ncbi:major facilitator superfamily domain-containing protein [Podospora fimiseda]|uniref:Major facilitator superfamily domain-containing protein n=1 Tax=Podospora fimiseda TaxID=252190 RepID=A0AAN7GWZ5_9PEZI|nr:major facilitator superfamily domain-containing protein [Podospora fimiseda]
MEEQHKERGRQREEEQAVSFSTESSFEGNDAEKQMTPPPDSSSISASIMTDDDDDDEDEDEDEEEPEEEEGIPLRPGRRQRYYNRERKDGSGGYTEEEENRVIMKFDRKLVMFVAGLYLLGFLDRSNIGNARIAGMDDDLQTSPPNDSLYEWSLTAFYIAYISFEWMSLLWRVVPAHIYVSALVFSWGLAASLQAVAINYPMLIFLRVLLGIGEAGFTGVPFYLSFFFKREELAFRTAIFISAAPLATSFASSLAWVILKISEKISPGIAAWRLLFLFEGFPSVLVAGLAWNIIPDSPEKAGYLSRREKKVAKLRLEGERKEDSGRKGIKYGFLVFLDPIAWMNGLILFLTNMAYSSLPVFLPTILRSMGHDSITSQALAAPPYLASFFLVLATANVSDSMKARGPLLIFHALSSAAGYTVLALSDSALLRLDPGSWVRYLAVYPAAIGFFNVVVLTITWNINNQRGETRQGAGFALMQVIGQLGPLIGTRLYPDRDGPYYINGMRVCAVAMAVVAVLALVMRWYMKRENRKMDMEDEEENGDVEGEEGDALVGTKKERRGERVKFRYML